MKNIIKVLGIITCMVVISFSMIGCGDPEEEEVGVGTINVTNDVTDNENTNWADLKDTGVLVILFQGDNEVTREDGLLAKSKFPNGSKLTVTFKDVKEGDNYMIRVKDKNDQADPNAVNPLNRGYYDSAKFSVAKDDVLNFSYNGTTVTKQ